MNENFDNITASVIDSNQKIFEKYIAQTEKHLLTANNGRYIGFLNDCLEVVLSIERRLQDIETDHDHLSEEDFTYIDNTVKKILKANYFIYRDFKSLVAKRQLHVPGLIRKMFQFLDVTLAILLQDKKGVNFFKSELSNHLKDVYATVSSNHNLVKILVNNMPKSSLKKKKKKKKGNLYSGVLSWYSMLNIIQAPPKEIFDGAESKKEFIVTRSLAGSDSSTRMETQLYELSIEIWIDSSDPLEVSNFIQIVSRLFSSLNDVELQIIDSKIGSYFQKWKIKIYSFLAKEETVELVQKGLTALESATLDSKIQPIEKGKIEIEKLKRELERDTSIEDHRKMQELNLLMKQEELELMKLKVKREKFELAKDICSAFSQGLVAVEANFRISIGAETIIEMNEGVLTVKGKNKVEEQFTEIEDVNDQSED